MFAVLKMKWRLTEGLDWIKFETCRVQLNKSKVRGLKIINNFCQN